MDDERDHRALPLEPVDRDPRAALTAAAAAYRARLLAAAERILRDPVEAEDAVQDALLSALRSLDGYRGESQLSTWLYRITLNAALMRLRSRRRRAEVRLDEGRPAPVPPEDLPSGTRPDEALLLAERLAAAGTALGRLSPVQLRALELREVWDLPVPEVARRIGRSATATKMLVHRARAQLRRDLASA